MRTHTRFSAYLCLSAISKVTTAHRAACSLSIDLSANEIPATGGHWRFAHATAVKGDKRSAVSFGNGDRSTKTINTDIYATRK